MSDKKFLIAEILDDIRNSLLSGIPIEATIADIISVVQSDKTKLKGIMELSGGTTAVTNSIWDKKEKPFKGSAYFSRPADGNAYTALDAITNSTSSPAIMTMNLSSWGVVAGDFIGITNVRVKESTKLSGAVVNAIIMPSTFTGTNDNAEFALSDAENQVGGIVIPCANLYTFLNNSHIASDSGLWIMQIPTGTSIFVALQAAIGFTAGNNSRWDVFVEGVIFK